MTITISQQTFDELLYQDTENSSEYPDPDDQLDVMYDYPKVLGQGYWREIKLRQGLELAIGDLRLCDRMITEDPETECWLNYHFHFSGEHEDKYTSIGSGKYIFRGSGLAPQGKTQCDHEQPFLEVEFTMQPDVLRSFAGNSEGELPKQLQHLIRPGDQYYHRCGTATLPMQRVAQQILHCPYRSIAKRMYLEGKVLELMGMLLAQEVEMRDGKTNIQPLQPDLVDRIHHAREIILQRLDNPPSLHELARQVGLNECTLKRGFRCCFGTTVFGYLRNYKLEQARQLLEIGEMKITEIAHAMGYNSRSPFAAAFRKQFGMNPKEYQKLQKNSV
ncbi:MULTISPECIES: AraC family transcriptional regulator [unclassified Nodularia (in: cyanobacteria)]|uniref:helix-turn-helix domain-containing protein n=1 Tax=unclassified Nodularia (in: cyanobacteria) TaxID=2656917 RepID=UPI00188096AC|nr:MULTISPECIES: AraC family transcriptional regulator [unclassified Nodularia (in: cyanobacteria)]MBE9198261.1 helix-turn-helix transcriptional regulator [Nodularia sp. LEGE 06071]MCC2695161.1 helix-turn-helix transcriptional regulator [Nodularia sp. LEGE 04288]